MNTYLVVDNTKFNGTVPFFIAPPNTISTLVTNKAVCDVWRSELKQHKIVIAGNSSIGDSFEVEQVETGV